MTGFIVSLQPLRSYGFVRGPDGRQYFFHRSHLSRVQFDDLRVNDAVECEADPTSERGPRCRIVRVPGAEWS